MKKLVTIILAIASISLQAQEINIIPKPVKTTLQKGSFKLSKSTVLLTTDDGEQNTANFFSDYLKRFYGLSLKTAKQATSNYIRLNTKKFIQPGQAGKYQLTVTPASIIIDGDNYQGTFYGMQSLIQLLPVENISAANKTYSIPALSIEDYPRFSYRGMHLDVGRHFMPVDFVKKYIDYLALHKMNYFHWHLTDDQGWRIEIKKYPRLTEVGAFRNGTIIGHYPGKGNDNQRSGGFYTQEEIKDVVDYAAKRFITIVPEIEMPGHSGAAIAAYPWLSCFPDEKTKIPADMGSEVSKNTNGKVVQESWGVFDDVFCAGKDSTFQFLQDVIDEVIQLFPGPYIHVGGDESPKNNWKRCPNCQRRIKDNNLKDEHQLQSYFIQRMERYINGKGKTLIGWDEILEGGLAPNAIVMSWRGEQGGIDAAKQDHMVVMTPGGYVYLDHSQTKKEDSVTIGGYLPLETVYDYDPVPKDLPADKAKFVLGSQGNLWTEYISNARKVEYMIFPRMSALSEVLWTPKENKDWNDFQKRLPTQFKRYELWKSNYSKAFYQLKSTVSSSPMNDGLNWALDSKLKCKGCEIKLIEMVPDRKKSPSPGIYVDSTYEYKSPIKIKTSRRFEAVLFDNKKVVDQLVEDFYINKASGKKISLTKDPIAAYPGEGGAFGLVNGLESTNGIISSEWLGWRGDDMEAVLDLSKNQSINKVRIHALSRGGSRVYPPVELQVQTSTDGINFSSAGSTTQFEQDTNEPSGNMTLTLNPNNTRYVKVIAKNYQKIPEGKTGAGDPALMLIDEISVE